MGSTQQKPHVVIIGGGASGALTLLKCANRFGNSATLSIVEPRQELGLGLAYSTFDQTQILNVPASKMTIEPNAPLDFQNWLESHHPEAKAFATWPFVPRAWFGEYLQFKLKCSRTPFRHIASKVIKLSSGFKRWKLQLANGEHLIADFVVVATGYETASSEKVLRAKDLKVGERVLQATDHRAIKALGKNESVLIVGTGLSAVDVYRQLIETNQKPIRMLSRHGWLPIPHPKAPVASPACLPRLVGLSPLCTFHIVRGFAKASGQPWPVLVDQIRLEAQAIWSCWSLRERAQFLRHLKPYWEIVRHRLPERVADDLAEAQAADRLIVHSGKIFSTEATAEGVKVCYQARAGGAMQSFLCDWIVLATGAKINQELLAEREQLGLRRCSFGFGYMNKNTPNLWLAGPSSKSRLWEITAMREIVLQAEQISFHIAQRLEGTRSDNMFTYHPGTVGWGYWHHFRRSLGYSIWFLRFAMMSFSHAIFPFLFSDTTSNELRDLSHKLSRSRVCKENGRRPGGEVKALPLGRATEAATPEELVKVTRS